MTSKKITLGILNADELAPEVEKEFGNYSDMFQRLFEKNNHPFIFKSYQVTQEIYPLDIDECDAYLVTGSKFNVYENIPWIIKLNKFIQQLSKKNKKIIGICFGHQIIAQALGGLVSKSNNGWGVGLMSSTVIKNQTWMRPAHNSISLLGIHQDQVIELPKDAVLLAESDFALIVAFKLEILFLLFRATLNSVKTIYYI